MADTERPAKKKKSLSALREPLIDVFTSEVNKIELLIQPAHPLLKTPAAPAPPKKGPTRTKGSLEQTVMHLNILNKMITIGSLYNTS